MALVSLPGDGRFGHSGIGAYVDGHGCRVPFCNVWEACLVNLWHKMHQKSPTREKMTTHTHTLVTIKRNSCHPQLYRPNLGKITTVIWSGESRAINVARVTSQHETCYARAGNNFSCMRRNWLLHSIKNLPIWVAMDQMGLKLIEQGNLGGSTSLQAISRLESHFVHSNYSIVFPSDQK